MQSVVRLLAGVLAWTLAIQLGPVEARAEATRDVPKLGLRAMPELFQLATPDSAQGYSMAASLGLGHIDAVGRVPGAERIGSSVAAAYAVLPNLSLGLDFRGHLDLFPGANEGANGVGEPRLSAQGVVFRAQEFALGWAVFLRLPGASAPSIAWDAATPSMRALGSYQLNSTLRLVLNLGLELDQSYKSVQDYSLLSDADRITLGLGKGPTLPVGLGLSARFEAFPHEALVEIFGRPQVGDNAADFGECPWALKLGVRPHLSRTISGMLGVEVGLSARSWNQLESSVVPIEPRVGLMLGVMYAPEPGYARSEPERPPPPEPPPAPRPPSSVAVDVELGGRVVSESGEALVDATVRVMEQGQEVARATVDAEGRFELEDLPNRPSFEVAVEALDYETKTLTVEAGAQAEVILYPALPAGVVEGRISDYKDQPLSAKVRVLPLGVEVLAAEDGRFHLELPPGKYSLTVEAVGFRSETRVVQVENRGVFILNLAMSR